MTRARTTVLNSAASMPGVGLGTWSLADTRASAREALEVGYRHFDTASQYGNESELGRALAESAVPRDEVFITTKVLSRQAHEAERVLEASLRALRTDYVDLWLVHDPPPADVSLDLWGRMIRTVERGMVRSIGVSEFSSEHIRRLHAASGVMPAVNQIRWAPPLYSLAKLEAHESLGVTVVGFSGLRLTDLQHPVLTGIAAERGVTAAEVLIAWHRAHRVIVIPRSNNSTRLLANLLAYDLDLSEDEVGRIDGLSVVDDAGGLRGEEQPGHRLLGMTGTIVAPTATEAGAGEIAIEGEPAILAWSDDHLPSGTMARVVQVRGPRAVQVRAA